MVFAQGVVIAPTHSTQVKKDYATCPRSHRKTVTELGTKPTSQIMNLTPTTPFALVFQGLPFHFPSRVVIITTTGPSLALLHSCETGSLYSEKLLLRPKQQTEILGHNQVLLIWMKPNPIFLFNLYSHIKNFFGLWVPRSCVSCSPSVQWHLGPSVMWEAWLNLTKNIDSWSFLWATTSQPVPSLGLLTVLKT